MPVRGRRGHPLNKWTPEEVDVIYSCLRDPIFMANHNYYPAAQFPLERASATCIAEGSEYHRLCHAIATRVLEEAGEANQHVQRSLQAIALKIQALREHALATCEGGAQLSPSQLFEAFDLNSFHEEPRTLPRRTEPGAAEPFAVPAGEYPPPVRDAVQITFQTRLLNAHLACSLCMGYLQEACTIIECLHTFCKRCIKEHFARSHVCPSCQLDLGANPAELVRNDRTLQSLVDRVFPLPPDSDACGHDGGDAPARGDGERNRRSLSIEPQAKRRGRIEQHDEKLSFSLQEQPDTLLPLHLERPFFLVDSTMSMAHFACYLLGTAGDIGADCVLQFFCHEQLLRPDWTLAYVYREYWNNPLQDMMMTFRVAKREARKSAASAPAAAPPALHGGADARPW